MKRLLVGLFIGLLAGGVVGFGVGIIVYPFWFLNDAAQEALVPDASRTRLAGGEFIHVNPSDPFHWGKGNVSLYREGQDLAMVHLQEDFEVGPGPRYHVYLVEKAEVRSDEDFLAAPSLDLGRLRAFKGSQIYALPPATETGRFASVVVWCKEFNVLISPASLKAGR